MGKKVVKESTKKIVKNATARLNTKVKKTSKTTKKVNKKIKKTTINTSKIPQSSPKTSKSSIKKTDHLSWKSGDICKGCQLCVNGEKTVIFATGICTVPNCYCCPTASTKFQKDYTYANERRVVKKQDIIEETKLSNAKGAGITGGDVLMKIDRVSTFIELLKSEFGKEFHIHLYTPIKHVTNLKLERLYDAGLDEIRLLPDLDDDQDWQKVEITKKFNWQVGIELPAIPGNEDKTKKLIDYIAGKIDFLNINEFEVYDNDAYHANQKDILNNEVDGSHDSALELLKYASKKKINVHFCSSRAKDAVQFKNRIKKRAENIANEYDFITDQGTLFRGAIYIDETSPNVGYRHKLEILNKRPLIKKLFKIKRELQRKFNIPFNLMDIDEYKLRILTSPEIVEEFKIGLKKMKLTPALVEEYPTYDGLEVDIEFL